MAKQTPSSNTTTSSTATTDATIGAAYRIFRRLECEHDEIKARNPHDGQILGRGAELTRARDAALAAVRAAADAAIDAERGE